MRFELMVGQLLEEAEVEGLEVKRIEVSKESLYKLRFRNEKRVSMPDDMPAMDGFGRKAVAPLYLFGIPIVPEHYPHAKWDPMSEQPGDYRWLCAQFAMCCTELASLENAHKLRTVIGSRLYKPGIHSLVVQIQAELRNPRLALDEWDEWDDVAMEWVPAKKVARMRALIVEARELLDDAILHQAEDWCHRVSRWKKTAMSREDGDGKED